MDSHKQEHKISLLTATLLSMNILIGSGILIGPGKITAISGNASFLAWPLVALMFLPLVLCTAQLSIMFPGCAGFYSYTKEGLGKTAGFFAGWLYIAGYTFACVVDLLAIREMFVNNGIKNAVTTNLALFSLVFIAISVWLNLKGLKFVSNILNGLTITKILPLLILILLLPFFINFNFTISATELSLIPSSITLAIFGFFGFEYCCGLSHLMKDPEKNTAKAILFSFLLTAGLYTLFHFGVLNLMGAENLSKLNASAFADFINLPVPYLKQFLMFLIPVASILTVFAGFNGMLNANSIMLHSMAQNKLFAFWPFFQKVNKNNRPIIAIFILAAVIFVLGLLIPNINVIGNMTNITILLAFLFPFISLFILQKMRKLNNKLLLTAIALIITTSLLLYSIKLLGNSLNERLINTLPIIATIALGYLLFFFRKENNK